MASIYDLVLKAYDELKKDGGGPVRPGYVVLKDETQTLYVDAWFDGSGALDSIHVGALTERADAPKEAISKYGGRNFIFAMQKKTGWEEIFRIKVNQGRFLYDTIDAEFPKKMDKDEANAAMEALDVLGMSYGRKRDGSPSVGRARWHRELGAKEALAVLETMKSREHYKHYVFTAGKNTNAHVRKGTVLVGMNFDGRTGESEKKRRIDELQSFMERDPACLCDGLKVVYKKYRLLG